MLPSGLIRWILPRGLVRSCDELRLEVLAGREIQLAVVAERQRAAVMLRIGVVGILVQHDLAPLIVPVSEAFAVNRDSRSLFGVAVV